MLIKNLNITRFLTIATLVLVFSAVKASEAEDPASAKKKESSKVQRVVFLGDSLTAGYRLDPQQAFPALIGEKLTAEGKSVEVLNAGLSGDTSAGGLRRIDWLLRRPADIYIIALGANDALRGQDPKGTAQNLSAIIQKVRTQNPAAKVLLAGMYAPPNMGLEYAGQFNAIYPEIAEQNGVALMPFLLESVAGDRSMNLDDGIHPNPQGHKIIADNLLPYLKPLLD